jgi:hypothetical protein
LFNAYYGAGTNRTGVTGPLTGGVLALDELAAGDTPAIAAAKAALLASPHFARAGDQIITYPGDDTATEDVDEGEARMFAGTFNGIPGEYTCTGDLCQTTADAKGNLLTFVGTWSFDPDSAPEGKPHKVFGVTPDPDHIHFGYWLKTTPGEDGEPTTYEIDTFAGGSDADGAATYDAGTVSALLGQAEYEGDAAGIYVRKTLKSTGEVASAVTGEFQADADLTAYFGGEDVRASNAFHIEGTVTNFMDGSKELSGWTVTLKKREFTNNASAFTAGETVGSAGVDEGAWSGTFFGPQVTDDPDTTTVDESENVHPTGVAGEFNAHFSNGHVAGAYGTTIVED